MPMSFLHYYMSRQPMWTDQEMNADTQMITNNPPTQVLFLFSIGITKGKWGTLLSALLAFRADYER